MCCLPAAFCDGLVDSYIHNPSHGQAIGRPKAEDLDVIRQVAEHGGYIRGGLPLTSGA